MEVIYPVLVMGTYKRFKSRFLFGKRVRWSPLWDSVSLMYLYRKDAFDDGMRIQADGMILR